MNEDNNVLALVFTGVVSLCYLIIGLVTSVMSGVGNVLIVLIYAALATFFVARNIFKDEVSDAQGFSGMIFVVSSVIFLHTSAPIWGEDQYCQSQYGVIGNNTYTFQYGELREGKSIAKDYSYCISKGGFSYMMYEGELQPSLFWLSSVVTAISLLIFIISNTPATKTNPSLKRKPKKPKHKGIVALEKELKACEKIIAEVKQSKKDSPKMLQKPFYRKLMKLSDMLSYFSEFQSDSEYSKREKRIDAMQKFASKKASETFKGDTKKISQIIEELSYTAGQGFYFADQHDKWWQKYL